MFKKAMAVISAAIITLAMGVTAFAATNTSPESPKGYLAFRDYVPAEDVDVDALCQEINAGTKTIADIPGVNVNGATAITKMLDVYEVVSPVEYSAPATATISTLDQTMANLRAVHYNTVLGAWEVIAANSVDYNGKTATFTFTCTSPAIIVADIAESSTDTSTTPVSTTGNTSVTNTSSPKTGDTSNAGMYVVIAAVAGIAAIVAIGVFKRKSPKA